MAGLPHDGLAAVDSTGFFTFSRSWIQGLHHLPEGSSGAKSFNISEIYLANDYYTIASVALEQGYVDQAIAFLEKASYHYSLGDDWHSYVSCILEAAKGYSSQSKNMKAIDLLREGLNVVDMKFYNADILHAALHHELGIALFRQGQKVESIQHFLESIALRRDLNGDNDPLLADTYNKLGVNYYMVGEFDKALEAYQKALHLSDRVEVKPIVIAEICNNIGIVLKLKGDLVESLDYYHRSLELKESVLPPEDAKLGSTYNNLGNLHRIMGQSEMAMIYYEKAESIFKAKYGAHYPMVGKIYLNMGIIYTLNGDYGRALQYLNHALTILENDETSAEEIASVYNNLGNVYYQLKDYEKSLFYYSRSVSRREQDASIFLSRSYSNIALCYYELNQYKNAQKYHQLSVDYLIRYFGDDHYLLAAEYLNFGQFFINTGEKQKGLNLYVEAYDIFRHNYGEQHPDVSSCLVNIGDFYYKEGNYAAALNYYQESLYSIVNGYSSKSNIYSNPDIDQRILSKTELLNALSRKALALKDYYKNSTHDVKDLQMSLSTFELALELMDNIRIGHITIESKLELAKNQRKLFRDAVQTAFEAYNETGNTEYQSLAFQFAEKGKAAMLYDFIRENDAKHYAHIPDSLINIEHKIKEDITIYQRLIDEEILKTARERDNAKLAFWEEKLFDLQAKQTELVQYFNVHYPKYYHYKYTNKIYSVQEIQAALDDKDAMIEYFLDNDVIYTFFISRNKMKIYEKKIDSSLYHYVDALPNNQTLDEILNHASVTYTNYIISSYQLYHLLLQPLESDIIDKNLIIIPDGILGYVSFESLLTDEVLSATIDYKNLPYLLRTNTINYGYTGTLYLNSLKAERSGETKEDLLAFAPVYFYKESLAAVYPNFPYRTRGENLIDLPATLQEVKDIKKILRGDIYLNASATVEKFKEIAANYRILHIATHGIVDNINPLKSRLVFSPVTEESDGGCLYYSDLFNLDLNADMAVLSACNTGYGQNSEGEGIIALSRGFMYSGVPSLVISLWSVEDESTALIMKNFYKYLKEGLSKDEALRKSKLDYLSVSNHIGSSPYYWSGFINIGNNNPLQFTSHGILSMMLFWVVFIPLFLLAFFYNIRKARKV